MDVTLTSIRPVISSRTLTQWVLSVLKKMGIQLTHPVISMAFHWPMRPTGLVQLAHDPRLAACMVKQLYRHATGRLDEPGEAASLQAIGEAFAKTSIDSIHSP